MCDANYRFRYIEVGDPGGSSDAGLYNVSPLKEAFRRGKKKTVNHMLIFFSYKSKMKFMSKATCKCASCLESEE